MDLLPDLVGARPLVVLCGMTTVGGRPGPVDGHRAGREHYYEGPGNAFWTLLHDSGLCPERLGPEQDARVVRHRLGLTDLVRTPGERPGDPPTYDVAGLADRLAGWRPEWVAFTSKTTAAAVAGFLGERRPRLGEAPWELAGVSVFVLPGTSGANRRRDYDGRPDRLSWWVELAALAGR